MSGIQSRRNALLQRQGLIALFNVDLFIILESKYAILGDVFYLSLRNVFVRLYFALREISRIQSAILWDIQIEYSNRRNQNSSFKIVT